MTTPVPQQVDALAMAKPAEGPNAAHQAGLIRIVQGLRRVDTGTYALRTRGAPGFSAWCSDHLVRIVSW